MDMMPVLGAIFLYSLSMLWFREAICDRGTKSANHSWVPWSRMVNYTRLPRVEPEEDG